MRQERGAEVRLLGRGRPPLGPGLPQLQVWGQNRKRPSRRRVPACTDLGRMCMCKGR